MAAICIGQTGRRIQLLCPDESELTLSEARIVHAADDAVDISAPRDSLVELLQTSMNQQAELSREIDPADLWRKVDAPGSERAVPDLARAAFGNEASALHEAAIISALVSDHVYFKLQGRSFLVNTPEQAEIQKQKQRKKQEQERFISHSLTWLQAALAGQAVSIKDGAACIEMLKDYAALGRESETWSEVRDILKGAGIQEQRQCFDLLVRLGIFDPDENLLLRRHGISHDWPTEAMEQVEGIGAGAICTAVNDPARRDFTHQYACAIDEAFTRDVDDAVSFRFDGPDLELGIHITDVSAFVEAATPIDKEAEKRGSSLYLPEAKIPMLPPALSEHIASFRVGERSPALSFIARVNADGDVLDYCIVRSVIRIDERLTYGEADKAIAEGSNMARLHRFALALRKKRLQAGGLFFLLPEMQVRVDRSHEIMLKLRDREMPGQVLVSECMILANSCAARYLQENRHPGLFRRQAEPAKRIAPAESPGMYDLFLQRRMLRRVEVSTAPGPHCSLGLPCYTSITSPLRKYLDLVMQRQLVSLLEGGPAAYTRRELSDITLVVQPTLARASVAEHARWRYWILKAMKNSGEDCLEALVLDRSHGAYELILIKFLLHASLKEQDAGKLTPGSTIQVRVELIDPFTGKIQLSIADPEKGHKQETPHGISPDSP